MVEYKFDEDELDTIHINRYVDGELYLTQHLRIEQVIDLLNFCIKHGGLTREEIMKKVIFNTEENIWEDLFPKTIKGDYLNVEYETPGTCRGSSNIKYRVCFKDGELIIPRELVMEIVSDIWEL